MHTKCRKETETEISNRQNKIYIQEDATLHCLFLDTSFKFKTSGHMNRII